MSGGKKRGMSSFLNLDDVTNIDLEEEETTTPAKPAPRKTHNPAVGMVQSGESKAVGIIDQTLELKEHEIQQLKQESEQKIQSLEQQLEAAREEGKVIVLEMPVTKQRVSFKLQYIDADLIDVSPENERDQSMLDEFSLHDILPSIKKDKQQKAGTVRPKGNGRFELIEGSRRLACVKITGDKYMAFVGDVPDLDVHRLSRIENRHKQISVYERARFIQNQIESGVYEDWENAAALEKFSRATAFRMRRVALLDEDFVRCLPSPSDLKTAHADWLMTKLQDENLAKKLRSKAHELREERQQRLGAGEKAKEADEIFEELKKSIRVKATATASPSKKKPVVYSSNSGEVVMKHSVTSKGNTKIELAGVSDDKLEKVMAFLMKSLAVELKD